MVTASLKVQRFVYHTRSAAAGFIRPAAQISLHSGVSGMRAGGRIVK